MSGSILPERWATLAPLIDAVLERPIPDRSAFLDDVCAGDPALRAELEAMLSECTRSDAMLDGVALDRFAPLLEEPPLESGTVLADRYRVERPIGAGGMATVYLARDLQHDRNVAIKVLSARLGALLGANRFLNEITLTANLLHPNLLPLFDSGNAGGLLYYVMPYVEGESLRARLARDTRLPVDDVVRMTRRVAAALDYAHAQGIVHRDLKPENILVQAGEPLLADFGIAIAVANAGGERITEAGISLGTPQYMSPEQAAGGRVDARSDVYSLACVVYEMLIGEPPFTGPSSSSIITKHLTEPPPRASDARDEISAAIDRAIEKAMAKTPVDRFDTAGQFADALTAPNIVAPSAAWRRRTPVFAGALLLAIGAIVAAITKRSHGRASGDNVASFAVPITAYEGFETHPDISADGKWVVFSWDQGRENRGLFVVPSTGGVTPAVQRTSGEADDTYATWSPDAREIAFVRSRDTGSMAEIMIMPALGGEPRRVTRTASVRGLAWSPDGTLMAFADKPASDSLSRVFLLSLETGERRQVSRVQPSDGPVYDGDPQFSPDGRAIAFLRRQWRSGSRGEVYTQRLNDSVAVKRTSLGSYAWGVDWLDAETLLFATGPYSGRYLVRVPLDGGETQRLGVGAGAWHLSVARTSGALVFDEHVQDYNIWRIPGPLGARTGKPEKLIGSTRDELAPSYSPDGRQIAFISARSETPELWLAESDGTHQRQLTNFGSVFSSTWLPDGQSIVFGGASSRIRRGRASVFAIDASGGFPRRVANDDETYANPTVTADGRWIYFQSHVDKSGWGLWRVSSAGGQPERIDKGPVLWPRASANGSIYYFVAPDEVWNLPGDGGRPHLALKAVRGLEWTVWRDNIVSLRHTETTTTFQILDRSSGRTTDLATLPRFPTMVNGRKEDDLIKSLTALTVSADGRWIAYSHLDRVGSDLMFVSKLK